MLKIPLPAYLAVALAITVAYLFFSANSPEAKGWHNVASIEPDSEAVTFVGAGDIASCESYGDEQTAMLLNAIPGTVFTLGDNVYSGSTLKMFSECYASSWGRHRARTMPSAGNHEYDDPGAAGYFGYFGEKAGDPEKGYYSYNLGKWHIIVLNSNCPEVSCNWGSPQERWLAEDLSANSSLCTLAYMHHPPFSSGVLGMKGLLRPLWQDMRDFGVDVVLAGHDHSYERMAPLDANGVPSETGTRIFIVGTGGVNHRPLEKPIPGSEARNDQTFGVLNLTLKPAGYDWEFVPAEGGVFTDSGSGKCQ